jgi:hypothetical protein
MKFRVRLAAGIAAALIALLPVATPAQSRTDIDKAIGTNVGDPVKVHETFTQLQQAAAKPDAAAALVNYPITINPRTNKAMRIRTPEAFAAQL